MRNINIVIKTDDLCHILRIFLSGNANMIEEV